MYTCLLIDMTTKKGMNNVNEVKWIKAPYDLSDAYKIRISVFVIEQKIPFNLEIDNYDLISDHIIIYNSSRAVATGRIVYKDKKIFLGRIAVLKEYRHMNYGSLLIRKMLDKVFESENKTVFVHAQKYAQNFYEKLGFQRYGNEFIEDGIVHVNMKVTLDRYYSIYKNCIAGD